VSHNETESDVPLVSAAYKPSESANKSVKTNAAL